MSRKRNTESKTHCFPKCQKISAWILCFSFSLAAQHLKACLVELSRLPVSRPSAYSMFTASLACFLVVHLLWWLHLRMCFVDTAVEFDLDVCMYPLLPTCLLVLAYLRFVLVRAFLVCACVGYVRVRVCCGLVVVVTLTLMEFSHVNTAQNPTQVLR